MKYSRMFNIYKVGDDIHAISRESASRLHGIDMNKHPLTMHTVIIYRSSQYSNEYGDMIDLISWMQFYKEYICEEKFTLDDMEKICNAMCIVKDKVIEYDQATMTGAE